MRLLLKRSEPKFRATKTPRTLKKKGSLAAVGAMVSSHSVLNPDFTVQFARPWEI